MNEIIMPSKNCSKRFCFNKTDLLKIGKGALIAGLGAGMVCFLQDFKEMDLGQWGPIAAALSAVLINVFRKWTAGKGGKV